LLAERLGEGGATFVEIDSLFSLLLPRSNRNREDRMLAYDAAHALTGAVVQRGRTAILECTYARQEQRASLVEAMAHVPAAPLWVVELFVSPTEAVRRFRRRAEATDLDEESLRERVENFPYSEQAFRPVATDFATDHLANDISEWLSTQPGSVDRDLWVAAGRGWD
jgi:predicted kinase